VRNELSFAAFPPGSQGGNSHSYQRGP